MSNGAKIPNFRLKKKKQEKAGQRGNKALHKNDDRKEHKNGGLKVGTTAALAAQKQIRY